MHPLALNKSCKCRIILEDSLQAIMMAAVEIYRFKPLVFQLTKFQQVWRLSTTALQIIGESTNYAKKMHKLEI
jgi:hypothetical protein